MSEARAAGAVEAAFLAACRAELEALKPGNVHVHADGHRMTVRDFLLSAEVAAPFVAAAGRPVGRRVREAVAATQAAVGQNTNLGILLLVAPLAAAAERGGGLRPALTHVLEGLTVEDAAEVFAAIRLASPGGLGRAAEHDVAQEPTVTLLEAMQAAADRDRIARQYVTLFEDVLTLGLPRLQACRAAGWPEDWAVTATFLAFMARFPDTHVARKHGAAVAEAARRLAVAADLRLLRSGPDADVRVDLMALDQRLKRDGINPGTSADLTVATHFVAALQ